MNTKLLLLVVISLFAAGPAFAETEHAMRQALIDQAHVNAAAPHTVGGYRGTEIGVGSLNGTIHSVQGDAHIVRWGDAVNQGVVPFGHTQPGFNFTGSVPFSEVIHSFGGPLDGSSGIPHPLVLSGGDFNFAVNGPAVARNRPHIMYTVGSLQQTANGYVVVPLTPGRRPMGFQFTPQADGSMLVVVYDGHTPVPALNSTYRRFGAGFFVPVANAPAAGNAPVAVPAAARNRIIRLPPRRAIAFSWGQFIHDLLFPPPLGPPQVLHMANVGSAMAGTAVVASLAAWSAGNIVTSDFHMRRNILLRANSDALLADYEAWLRSPASGLSPDVFQHAADQNVTRAQVGYNYVAYFYSVPELIAAQQYYEYDSAGEPWNANAFQNIGRSAFDRYFMARFLSETGWRPPYYYVSVRTDYAWYHGRCPNLTWTYMAHRGANGQPDRYTALVQVQSPEGLYLDLGDTRTPAQFAAMIQARNLLGPVLETRYDMPAPTAPSLARPWGDLPRVPLSIDGNAAYAVAVARAGLDGTTPPSPPDTDSGGGGGGDADPGDDTPPPPVEDPDGPPPDTTSGTSLPDLAGTCANGHSLMYCSVANGQITYSANAPGSGTDDFGFSPLVTRTPVLTNYYTCALTGLKVSWATSPAAIAATSTLYCPLQCPECLCNAVTPGQLSPGGTISCVGGGTPDATMDPRWPLQPPQTPNDDGGDDDGDDDGGGGPAGPTFSWNAKNVMPEATDATMACRSAGGLTTEVPVAFDGCQAGEGWSPTLPSFVRFNGSLTALLFGSLESLPAWTAPQELTVAVWATITGDGMGNGLGTSASLLSVRGPDGSQLTPFQFSLTGIPSAQLAFGINQSLGATLPSARVLVGLPNDDVPHLFVGTFSSSTRTMTLHRDGGAPVSTTSPTPLQIQYGSASYPWVGGNFHGKLHSVHLYTRVLSPAEIAALHAQGYLGAP